MTDEPPRPSGTVVFLFTDVEGSTRLWEEHSNEMQAALEHHDQILRRSILANNGYVFSTAGDAFAAAFESVTDAVDVAHSVQRALAETTWPGATSIRVRMGLHLGEAQERDGNYFGPVLNRAARIMSAGHGGQVLLSSASAALLTGYELVDLGRHRLKDLAEAEGLWQLGLGSFPPLNTLDALRHNLPVERTPLVGRASAIDEITGLLTEHRLVTLLGIGGTGKTRLAAAVAGELADEFGDGVWFVDLIPASDGDDVVEAVSSAIGLQVGGEDRLQALAALTAEREVLIVLDNCEHLTDEVADVVDVLLDRTTAPRFLATSREPLQLIDERHVHVEPLAVGEGMAAPAVELFVGAAERVGAPIDAADFAIVERICADLDGLPLSVELAATQLRQLSLDELAGRLDQRFELLSQRRGGRARRQASLQAVLEGTWGMLDDPERQLLMQVAAFPAGFFVDDVEGVAAGLEVGSIPRALGGLVDRSVVARDGTGAHKLLETVKLFARDRWAETGAGDVYLDRHSAWLTEKLGSLPASDWYTSLALAAWSARHYDDLRAVEDRLATTGRAAELVDFLATQITSYTFFNSPRASAAVERIDHYLASLSLDEQQRGMLYLFQANATLPARRQDVMIAASNEAVRLLRPHGPAHALAWALMINSWMKAFTQNAEALADLEEAFELTDNERYGPIADSILSYQANHLVLAGRVDDASEVLERIENRLDDRPADYPRVNTAGIIAALELTANVDRARSALRASRTAFQRLIGEPGLQWADWLLGSAVAAAAGDTIEAIDMLTDAEHHVRRVSDDTGLPDLLLPPAVVAWRAGDIDRCRRYLTAIRRAPRPTQFFPTTIAFRRLRDVVGLDTVDPLEHTTIDEVYREARRWLSEFAEGAAD